MINRFENQKSKALSLHQLKEHLEAEQNLQPLELVSVPVNRKALERTARAERIEQLYHQARNEVAAKMNLRREERLNSAATWTN
jgi:hypothetical protein